jgi:hypothetical protein
MHKVFSCGISKANYVKVQEQWEVFLMNYGTLTSLSFVSDDFEFADGAERWKVF